MLRGDAGLKKVLEKDEKMELPYHGAGMRIRGDFIGYECLCGPLCCLMHVTSTSRGGAEEGGPNPVEYLNRREEGGNDCKPNRQRPDEVSEVRGT